ncbi:ABC transporter ATP-binding protein [Microcella daejeonensis]|uniref:ABC transporter ATP-binding protein n=1 Tax=Microcella daejeonensis TaxID=2994971 RepID=UPI00226E4F5C|nr:ABC transporter ATP-binding protein [Microcella daejeonensis]WAB84726.1 ABC transporter ATP-binding protein [Microcella daejeonensis]
MRVSFEAVTVDLGGRDVLRGATVEVEPGTVVGLVGPNGSGKSTLLRTLYRAVIPRSGVVRLDGEDVRSLSRRQTARSVAVMMQDPSTEFDLSVEEVVLLGRSPHHATFARDSPADRSIARDAMRRAGVDDLADRMIGTLSGGQRQRVMLARALTQQSPVLVLDEPSNHLDIRHQLELMGSIRDLGRTVIAALHDLNLAARYCDAIVVLDGGRVVGSGHPSDVLQPSLIRSTFGVHARIVDDGDDRVLTFHQPMTGNSSSAPRPTISTHRDESESLP